MRCRQICFAVIASWMISISGGLVFSQTCPRAQGSNESYPRLGKNLIPNSSININAAKQNLDLPSRVFIAHHGNAHDGSHGRDNVNLNADAVATMVNEAVKAFTETETVVEAWQQIIPDPSRKVAIKVNCQITGIYSKARVVEPIVNGLIASGVVAENIIIYDRTDNAFGYAGFTHNPSGPGVRVGVLGDGDLGGYSSHPELYEIAKLLIGETTDANCDYLINVPVCKALDGYSGVTLSMKNHYGTCTPRHDDIHNEICRTNSLAPIREKTRLIVLDACYCQYKWTGSRDQTYVDVLNKVIVGTDPVAIDYLGWQIIKQLRSDHGLAPVEPYPLFIDYAADTYFLGTNNPDQMEITELEVGPLIFEDGFEAGTTAAWS